MRASAICFCAIALIAGLLKSTSAQQGVSKEKESKNAPIACSLTALSASERERHKRLRDKIVGLVEQIRELPDGYEVQLRGDSDAIISVAEWVTLERLCCPFFTFQLQIEGAGKPFLLRLTGPEGVKEILKSGFGAR
jgi:hypothetical protein